jgi:hypothetical protein
MRTARMFYLTMLAIVLACETLACAGPLTYSATQIKGRVVDADSGEPIEGAVVVAQWVLFNIGPGHGGHKGRLHIHETMTDKDGYYMIPGWGPRIRPPMTELVNRDPEILIFKGTYEPKALYNSIARASSVRVSDWDGKIVKLKRTERGLEEQAFLLSSFFGRLESEDSNRDWYNYPKMLLAVYAELNRLRLLGLPPGHAGSIPNIKGFTKADRDYLEQFKK